MRDAEMEAEIEDFIEGFNQPTYRGMRINGEREDALEPAWVVWGPPAGRRVDRVLGEGI